MRLYVKPNTKEYDYTVALLHLYGIHTVLQKNKRGIYLNVTPPEFWKKKRKLTFQMAIERLEGFEP